VAEGIETLASGLPQSNLATLNLDNCSIGDEGASVLGRQLAKSSLTALDLESNRIGAAGAIALANGIVGSSLAHLKLRSNAIGDDGAVALAASLQHSKVTSFVLGWVGWGKDYCRIDSVYEKGAAALTASGFSCVPAKPPAPTKHYDSDSDGPGMMGDY